MVRTPPLFQAPYKSTKDCSSDVQTLISCVLLFHQHFASFAYITLSCINSCLSNPQNETCNVYRLFVFDFYIHDSVHRDSILIRSDKMQQYAGIYLLQIYSACFGCPSHPSSGVHETVAAASGTGHCIWATTFLQRGHWLHWRKIVAQIL